MPETMGVMMMVKKIELPDAVLTEFKKISTVASYLWERQWIERNGGNISLNLTGMITGLPDFPDGFQYIERQVPAGTAGMVVFITGGGARLRDLQNHIEEVGCILRIDKEEKGCHLLWGGEKDGFQPSSELIPHLMVHQEQMRLADGHRAVLHVHPLELIAMSHHPVLGHDEQKLNRACWSMLPEVRLFIPRGLALVPFCLPGSDELASQTAAALCSRDVVLWRKHGAVATGKDIHEAFDFIDVANKGASIYLQCLSAGFEPEGMSENEMERLMADCL
ncbi:rhamnulose-1-phosphate aldolase [Desulfomarina sp.]